MHTNKQLTASQMKLQWITGVPMKVFLQTIVYLMIYTIKTNKNIPDNLGPIPKYSHGHSGACFICRERQLPELGLLNTYFIVAMKPTSSKIFTPVGILIVNYQ